MHWSKTHVVSTVAAVLLNVTGGFTAEENSSDVRVVYGLVKHRDGPVIYTVATLEHDRTDRRHLAEPLNDYEIYWRVVSSGGTDATGFYHEEYQPSGTIGLPTAGHAADVNNEYFLKQGFWFLNGRCCGTSPSCCNVDGIRGNADGVTGAGGEIDVANLTYLATYSFVSGTPPPPCPC